jgi:hypothetical protein
MHTDGHRSCDFEEMDTRRCSFTRPSRMSAVKSPHFALKYERRRRRACNYEETFNFGASPGTALRRRFGMWCV